jgi:hypothetical protein
MIANGTAIVQRLTRSPRSIQIRLREWKGVLDQFDPRFRVLSDDNFNYVEAEKYVRIL